MKILIPGKKKILMALCAILCTSLVLHIAGNPAGTVAVNYSKSEIFKGWIEAGELIIFIILLVIVLYFTGGFKDKGDKPPSEKLVKQTKGGLNAVLDAFFWLFLLWCIATVIAPPDSGITAIPMSVIVLGACLCSAILLVTVLYFTEGFKNKEDKDSK